MMENRWMREDRWMDLIDGWIAGLMWERENGVERQCLVGKLGITRLVFLQCIRGEVSSIDS